MSGTLGSLGVDYNVLKNDEGGNRLSAEKWIITTLDWGFGTAWFNTIKRVPATSWVRYKGMVRGPHVGHACVGIHHLDINEGILSCVLDFSPFPLCLFCSSSFFKPFLSSLSVMSPERTNQV